MLEQQTISVVGGGWSFRDIDHHKVPGYCIAINDAAMHLQRPVNEIVSMDRLWAENRWTQLKARAVRTHLRRSAVQNIDEAHKLDWVNVFDCNHRTVEFSNYYRILNGTNSGTCGLNRAWQLRPRDLYLFAFDMCRDKDGIPYWYAPYPWVKPTGGTSNGKYNAWAVEFEQIAKAFSAIGTRVFNVSNVSKITCFQRLDPKDL